MKMYSDVKAEPNKGREILPAGGYVAKIMDAQVENTQYGDRLVISFDVSEGDFRGLFEKDYRGQVQEDKKWRGVYRMYLPKDDGTEKDGWSKRTLGGVIWAVESSNPGYHWDWDETTLKGKTVGVLFRDKEWEMDTTEGHKTGWTTECCKLIDADSIHQGDYKTPKAKPLDGKTVPATGRYSEVLDDDEDLPWKK